MPHWYSSDCASSLDTAAKAFHRCAQTRQVVGFGPFFISKRGGTGIKLAPGGACACAGPAGDCEEELRLAIPSFSRSAEQLPIGSSRVTSLLLTPCLLPMIRLRKDRDTNVEHWLYSQDSDTSRLSALSSSKTRSTNLSTQHKCRCDLATDTKMILSMLRTSPLSKKVR